MYNSTFSVRTRTLTNVGIYKYSLSIYYALNLLVQFVEMLLPTAVD